MTKIKKRPVLDSFQFKRARTHPYAHVGKCQDHTMHTCYVGKKIIVKTSF